MSSQAETFFTQITSQSLQLMVEQAKKSVIIAAPGIQKNVAEAILSAAKQLGSEMVIVCLDVSEHSLRLGYGDISAVEMLKDDGVLLQHVEHLRFALVVVDGNGYSFTPNALYLESDKSSSLGFNAIKLTTDQVREATVRLSPAAKAIAVAQCQDETTKQALNQITPSIEPLIVDNNVVENIGNMLKVAPPVAFDVSRQVRVYNAYLQYVEVSMTGAAIQRQKVAIPKVLQSIGSDNQELAGRLNTSFDLLAKDNILSSKKLEQKLKELRAAFTPSLGKKHGRVMLKSNKDLFNKQIKLFKDQLAEHAKEVESTLQANIDESIAKIAKYYLPIVKAKPPMDMQGKLGMFINDEQQVMDWISRQLNGAFPKAEKMISNMEVSVIYKDVTFENLNDEEFIDALKNAFPDINWEKAYQESIAAAGITSKNEIEK
ncbi:hypothetical protein [Paraglaciecola sp.]|uniref:hypothetical protein n=1 Tax=Paraglaciecola sp. TaxID=1920173 RepID=UPI003266F89A